MLSTSMMTIAKMLTINIVMIIIVTKMKIIKTPVSISGFEYYSLNA